MRRRNSSTAHAGHHDLLRLLQDKAATEIISRPHKRLRNGHAYWLEAFRTGTTGPNRYLGHDSLELAARIARHQELALQARDRAAARQRPIRLWRSEGLPTADRKTGSLLLAMERSGVFRLNRAFVGTQAFRLCEADLGLRLAQPELAQPAARPRNIACRPASSSRPGGLKKAYQDTLSRGRKWQGHIAASFARMPDSAALIAAL